MTDRVGGREGTEKGGEAIAPGLHLVATPIGSARDITLRALDILRGADILAAEDTRTLRHLMAIHGIDLAGRRLLAVHEHNEGEAVGTVLAALAVGKSVAYASEAGTPLISDPGFVLARAVAGAGHRVLAAPGPSALLAALAVAGLPADRFLFAGFPPAAAGGRRRFLEGLAGIEATVVLFESPRRVIATLGVIAEIFGRGRKMALCRELTKRHESVIRGTVEEVQASLGGTDPKGEIVLVIDRGETRASDEQGLRDALAAELPGRSVRDAVARVVQDHGANRREVYRLALAMRAAEEAAEDDQGR